MWYKVFRVEKYTGFDIFLPWAFCCAHGPLRLPPAVGAPTLLHPSAVHVNRGLARESQPGGRDVPGAQRELSQRYCWGPSLAVGWTARGKFCQSRFLFQRCPRCGGCRMQQPELKGSGHLPSAQALPEDLTAISGCRKMYWRNHVR